ncbi:thioredoxin family protein [Bacteroidota bacterium]
MKLKTFILALFSLFIINGISAQDKTESAETILKKAYLQAENEDKNVFIIFHASWCGWCHRMDTLMNREACKNLFEKDYVITHLVVQERGDKEHLNNPGATEMFKKHHGRGIPLWLIFDKNGKFLADSNMRPEGVALDQPGTNTGSPATKEEVDHFIKVLKETSSMKENELGIIAELFLQK